MESSYLPVPWVYREEIEDEIAKQAEGKVFYFGKENEICEEVGKIQEMVELTGEGTFIKLTTGNYIRIDRIITLFGKPGAAYDEYDSYANFCMDCLGGYSKEELDKE